MKSGFVDMSATSANADVDKIDVFMFLHEFSLIYLLWQSALGRRSGIIAILPMFPPLKPMFTKIFDYLKRKGRVVDVLEDRPDLAPVNTYPEYIRLFEPFPKAEKWLGQHFNFAENSIALADYAMPFKHVICNHTKMYPMFTNMIGQILKNSDVASIKISGVPKDIFSHFLYDTNDTPTDRLKPVAEFATLLNGLTCCVLSLISAFWILSKFRLRSREPEWYFLGSDVVSDMRLSVIWDEVSSRGQRVFLVYRYKDQRRDLIDEYPEWDLKALPSCVFSDAIFNFTGMCSALTLCLTDIYFLYSRLHRLSPNLFWQMAKLPLRRIMYRGLLNMCRFKNFLGRDDYNVEHIIRTQELRRVGCRHFGVLHGQPAEPPVLPQLRYIQYDTYYTFGSDWHRRYNHDTWPSDMEVKAVGSFSMTRAQLEQLKEPRPSDIACFIKDTFQTAETLRAIGIVAQAFPEKKIYLKPKEAPKGKFKQLIDQQLINSPGNIIETQEDSYDILLKTNFCLSDPSTLVCEAAQFGLVSFCMAFGDRWQNLYWRRFPYLCPEQPEEIVRRISAIEAGEEQYPIQNYRELIDLSGKVIWDVVLEDMGLEKLGSGLNAHLQFDQTV